MVENSFKVNGKLYEFKVSFKDKIEVDKGLQKFYAKIMSDKVISGELKEENLDEIMETSKVIASKNLSEEQYSAEDLKLIEKHSSNLDILNPIPYFYEAINEYLVKHYGFETDQEFDDWLETICVEHLESNISAIENFIVELYTSTFMLAVKQNQINTKKTKK